MKNILTIDVEEWYHALFSQQKSIDAGIKYESRIQSSVYKILHLLKKKKTTATFFVLGGVANKFPGLIQNISNENHEIAIHGYRHKQIKQMTPGEFRREICEARDCIKKIISKNPIGYRAPAFSLKQNMDWAFKILSEEGFLYDSSIFPTKNPLYGEPNAPRFPFWIEGKDWRIKEFPPSTLKVCGILVPVSGGFYLRTLHLSFIEHAIKEANKRGFSFILYFHPWELDVEQPRPKGITFRERFTHYFNLSTTFKKLEYLLNNFKFASIAEVENL